MDRVMRPLAVFAALALAASLGTAASAQTLAQTLAKPRMPSPATMPPPADAAPIPTIAEDRAAAAAMAATLTAFDERIQTDEVRMTQLRDAELATGNAMVRAIRPALAIRGKGAR